MSPKASLQFFDILQRIGFSKSPKGPPFTTFGIVRFFKMISFCLKITLSQYAISNFLGPAFFPCDFQFAFSKPRSMFIENITFCEHTGLFMVFGTMRLTGDLQKISKLRKNSCFLFFESLQLGQMWFSKLMRIPRGIFGTVTLRKFQQKCPFAYSK